MWSMKNKHTFPRQKIKAVAVVFKKNVILATLNQM